MNLEQFNKYSPFLAIGVCFLLDLILIMLSLWPLTVVAAIAGGLFCVEIKWGALSGTLGIISAWLVSFLLAKNDIIQQADQLGELIIGSSGAGAIIVLFIFIIGALFGFLGGIIGSGTRILIFNTLGSTQTKDPSQF
jgi:hypothetical protein